MSKIEDFLRYCSSLSLVVGCCILTSCSPWYVIEEAYQHAKLLSKREKISAVISNPETPANLRHKLEVVTEARNYAISIGLAPKGSFTKYTSFSRDVLTWVVVGSPPDSFALKTWWFPIVGSVPYKGFFDKDDAIKLAQKLQLDGYETSVRGSDAFSTLGWFDDPVLTPMLKATDARLASTVMHESTHTTIWVKNNVAFNESLAQFVGLTAAVDFYKSKLESCKPTDSTCILAAQADFDEAKNQRATEFAIGQTVFSLYNNLDALYRSNIDRELKLKRREEIFVTSVAQLRKEYPELKVLQKLNNAELIQLVLYLSHLDKFEALLNSENHSWTGFLDRISKIRDAVAAQSNGQVDPFDLL